MTPGRTRPGTARSRPGPGGLRLAVGLLAVAAAAALGALVAGGGRPQPPLPGLPTAGPLVEWALPFARLAFDLAAAGTIGLLVTAAVLLPSHTDALGRGARRASRLAAWWGLAWAGSALVVLVLSLADVLALPLRDALGTTVLRSFVTQTSQGGAYAAAAGLALAAAVFALVAQTPVGAWLGLVLASSALVPPALTGHAAGSRDHDLAMSGLLVHVLAVSLWAGGLAGLVWYGTSRRSGDRRGLAVAARRYSSLAGWAFLAVGVSGVAGALVRLPQPSDLWTSGYGRLVLLKTALFVVLGLMGWWHRTRTLPRLSAGRPQAFLRFGAVETLVLATTVGVGAALSRTPPPPSGSPTLPTPAESLLGFPTPPPMTWSRLVTQSRLDVLVLLVVLAMAVLYARGVLRLRRERIRWPVGRSLAWFAGVMTIAATTLTGIGTYGKVLFSMHMLGHMALGMLAPLLLVLGAPVMLALRALPASGESAGHPMGAREWVLAVLHSRVARVLTNPFVALLLFVSSTYLIYFSPLFGIAMRHHWGHLAMEAHFVLVGFLFYETVVGVDPLPHRASHPMRLIALFLSLPFHAFFAVALMGSSTVIAADYYAIVARPWGPSLLADQTGGAATAWALGEIPGLVAMIVLVAQWARDDDRAARRRDRRSDRDGDADLTAYNAMLARLGDADQQTRTH